MFEQFVAAGYHEPLYEIFITQNCFDHLRGRFIKFHVYVRSTWGPSLGVCDLASACYCDTGSGQKENENHWGNLHRSVSLPSS